MQNGLWNKLWKDIVGIVSFLSYGYGKDSFYLAPQFPDFIWHFPFLCKFIVCLCNDANTLVSSDYCQDIRVFCLLSVNNSRKGNLKIKLEHVIYYNFKYSRLK